VRIAKPWIDYKPAFLATDRANAIFNWLNEQSLRPETGECGKPPTHDTIQWGPRQAYISCVPVEYRVMSSGPIPVQLSKLHEEIEELYQAAFNTIQVNRHYDHNSYVQPHSDLMDGHIVMLSLGEERRFILRYKHDDKAKTLHRWKAGDIYFDNLLPSGSLLTIYKQHQFDLTHEMPKASSTCGVRISMIWRYITASVVNGPLGAPALYAGTPEYKAAQAAWIEKNGGKK